MRSILHLLAPTTVGLLAIYFCLTLATPFLWWELALIVPFVVFFNFAEWWAHRELLHKRRWWAVPLFEQHVRHHKLYTDTTMPAKLEDWGDVLIPPWGILLILLFTMPVALAMAFLLSVNAGFLLVTSAAVYVVSYEWLHLSYHLPWHSKFLQNHHKVHHATENMERYNFNITIPLWDWIMKTGVR